MSFTIDVNVRGTGAVAARVSTIAYAAQDAAEQALLEELLVELAEAKRRTPVDTGALRASGRVVGPTRASRALVGNIVFDQPYAVFVHEHLEVHHRVGQAKYLESVLLESARYFPSRVRDRMKQLLGT